MIPKDFIDTLLGRVDIVDVIDRRVPLKKAGQNYQACCPFHQEKSPSFTVSPTKQFYHCFGCGAHGTAIGFLIEYGGLSFVDAVKELAEDTGLAVPEDAGFSPRPKAAPQLGQALDAAATFYRHQLKEYPARDRLPEESRSDRHHRRPFRPRLCAGAGGWPESRVSRLSGDRTGHRRSGD